MSHQGKKSEQTVRVDGTRVATRIDGVKIHQQVTQQDERGTLTEIYSPYWEFDALPLVFLYTVTVRPGKAKGWAVHHDQVDRYFFFQGAIKLVLYDDRADSPTYRLVNELYFSEINRSLVLVPPYVYHAVQNVGTTDALLINLPSEPYRHNDPDKYTLPLNNDLIPYTFEPVIGY
jgi:dTDP-4-dehydrorhamnose 3,5-epimerase